MSPGYLKKSKYEVSSTEVFFSKDPKILPKFKLDHFRSNIFASYSGPDCGLTFVHKLETKDEGTPNNQLPAGCVKWTLKNRKAYGISMSLYDQHPINGKISGDPIADSFGLCARENCSLMIIADGVNWGEKSCLAARCAVYGAMKHINERLFQETVSNNNNDDDDKNSNNVKNCDNKKPLESTEDLFNLLLESLKEAHETIKKYEGGLTTLCVCFVCPIQESPITTPMPPSLLPPPCSLSLATPPAVSSPTPQSLKPPCSLSLATPPAISSPSSPKILASPESSSSPSPVMEENESLPDLLTSGIQLSSLQSSLPETPTSPPLLTPESMPNSTPKKFIACVVNVGDSLAFVFSRRHGVREITTGSHDVTSERDIRDAGGALGPVTSDGQPELNNLTCSMTCVDVGDVVFLATDGITDNFDPVVTKIAVAKKKTDKLSSSFPLENINEYEKPVDSDQSFDPTLNNTEDKYPKEIGRDSLTPNSDKTLQPILENLQLGCEGGKPIMLPYERHRYAIKEMERVLHEFELFTECPCSAQELCGALLQHVLKLTDPKRKVLENPELYGKKKKMKPEEKQNRDNQITTKLAQSPGKLDHATIIGYEVGCYHGDEDEDYCDDDVEN